jgi:hypothetical protein
LKKFWLLKLRPPGWSGYCGVAQTAKFIPGAAWIDHIGADWPPKPPPDPPPPDARIWVEPSLNVPVAVNC